MKELTTEEKAELYDKAIEVAKRNYETIVQMDKDCTFSREGIINTFHHMFPKLKEDGDEMIGKELIQYLKECTKTGRLLSKYSEEWIAWLKKQEDKDELIKELGEYKVKYTQEVLEKHINSVSKKDEERLRKTTIAFLKDFADKGYENAIECIDWLENQDEPKPDNKVEPKFRIGDIIRHKKHGFTCKIIAIDTEYRLSDCMGTHLPFDSQDAYELVEPKPEIKYIYTNFRVGDVIVEIKPNGSCQPVRVKYIGDGAYLCDSDDGTRSLSFPIIRQDEYKLVEQNSTWSKEDEVNLIDAIKYLELFDAQGIHGNVVVPCINWLKTLQGRVQPQPKQEWNEEDSKRLQRIIDFLWYNRKGDPDTIYQQEQDIEWLKSFRPQNNITDEELAQAKKDAYNDALNKIEYHSGKPTFDDGWSAAIWYLKKRNAQPQDNWRPSDEQMKALGIAIRCGIQLGTWEEIALKDLKEYLNKLMKE